MALVLRKERGREEGGSGFSWVLELYRRSQKTAGPRGSERSGCLRGRLRSCRTPHCAQWEAWELLGGHMIPWRGAGVSGRMLRGTAPLSLVQTTPNSLLSDPLPQPKP